MIENKTWSYTISGNDLACDYEWDYINLMNESLSHEELDEIGKDLFDNYNTTREIINRCYDIFISYAYMRKSRLAFQVLGQFLMDYGGKLNNGLKKIILQNSKWEFERKQLRNKMDRKKRRRYIFDFRAKILEYQEGKITKVPFESLAEVKERLKYEESINLPYCQSIDHKIIDINYDGDFMQKEFDVNLNYKLRLMNDPYGFSDIILVKVYKEYTINPYIILRLEENSNWAPFPRSHLYVNEELFIECSVIIANIHKEQRHEYNRLNSIDELVEIAFSNDIEDKSIEMDISDDLKFWAHCSNIQAWCDYGYDTRILHRNFAFPLLKKLTEVGDKKAKSVFKNEIARRFAGGHRSTVLYLIEENYIQFLNSNEKKALINNCQDSLEKFKDDEEIVKFLAKAVSD